jgi:hypothetical protein
MQRRLDFSCAAAALNCMAEGARGGIGSVAAIETLMQSAPRYPVPGNLPTVQRAMA